jgi:hypothetical protein
MKDGLIEREVINRPNPQGSSGQAAVTA